VRVLYLTHHLPWPVLSGGRLREAELLGRLGERFDVHVVAVSKTPGADRGALSAATAAGVTAEVFPAVPAMRVAGTLVRRHGSGPARRFLRGPMAAAFDVVHVEGHFLMPLLPPVLRRRAVLVEHNLESELFRQVARRRSGLGRLRALLEYYLTRRDERQAWRSARLVAALTEEDVRAVAAAVGSGRVRWTPNGSDHLPATTIEPVPALPGHRLVFVGNFAYGPNAEATRDLLDRILPAVRAAVGAVSLALVGAAPPAWLLRAAVADPGLEVTGAVPDVGPWLRAATVVVAPLWVGGGVKVKVIEALAFKKAVVTTAVGARGLPAGSVVRADGPAEFVAAVVELLRSEPRRREQEARAREAVGRLPSWDHAAELLAACWTGE
jgi:glycosyltransferase involved in cell wall biosynthesis